MKKLALCLLFLIIFTSQSFGQRLTLGLELFPAFVQDYPGTISVPFSGLKMQYKNSSDSKWASGFEFRSVPWGSELNVSESYGIQLLKRETYKVQNSTKLYLGIPLFYNKFSPSFSFSNEVIVNFSRLKRINLSMGIRGSTFPAYRKISENNSFLTGILGIQYIIVK